MPDSQFVGVDHSAEAIARGRQLAAGLGLSNIRFELGDLEHYEPERAGLVTMFDAFHHVMDPVGFIARVGKAADRFFLIEPAGNRLGQWQKTIDLDWMAEALFVMRDRLEYQFGLTPPAQSGSAPGPPAGEPTERRYSLDDFSRLFAGYGLDVCGTVAGLERYGTSPYSISPIRDEVGGIVYRLVGRDRGEPSARRPRPRREALGDLRRARPELSTAQAAEPSGAPIAPACRRPVRRRVRFLPGPGRSQGGHRRGRHCACGQPELEGVGQRAEDGPILLSYHWLDQRGGMLVEDGMRSPLPRPIAPGESATVAFRVRCPDRPGRCTLAIDLVHENVTWFSRAGVPALQIAWRIV